jgi:site-specific DNA recombinase
MKEGVTQRQPGGQIEASGNKKVLRFAVYARYSSVGNSPVSADEQIARMRFRLEAGQIKSKRFPDAEIVIDENWVIKDEAKTGRTGREGLDLLISGIHTNSFDGYLIDDLARLMRELSQALGLYDISNFKQVEGISVSENVSTADENARDLWVFKGYANEHQSKATSRNTQRGLEIRALGGFSTGHNPYGYYTVPTRNPGEDVRGFNKPSHYEIRIDPPKARIVVRIWSEFADGLGVRAIAAGLNRDGVEPPQGRGRPRRRGIQWSENTIKNMLRQKKYLGVWGYRKSKVMRNPITDRLVQIPRPAEERLEIVREDLRIVPVDLEKRVLARQQEIADARAEATSTDQRIFGKHAPLPTHLFTGILRCAACGGVFMLASGRHGGYFGCANGTRQTVVSCSVKKLARADWTETQLIGLIGAKLDDPKIHAEIANRFNKRMSEQSSEHPRRLAEIECELHDATKAIDNYEKFIRSGSWSERIAASLVSEEARLKKLQAEQIYLSGLLKDKVYITPGVVRSSMMDLKDILAESVPRANSVLRRLFPEQIAMTWVEEQKAFRACGVLSVGGALRSANSEDAGLDGLPVDHYFTFELDLERPKKVVNKSGK